MPGDYIPAIEAQLWEYAVQFSGYAAANQVVLNFSIGQTGDLAAALAAALAQDPEIVAEVEEVPFLVIHWLYVLPERSSLSSWSHAPPGVS